MEKFKVTKKAMRPASTEERCFYCNEKIGDYHTEDCVLITKTVQVKMTVTYPVEVPAHWSKRDVEFHRNDSSWCCNNAIAELDAISNELEKKGECFCLDDNMRFEYAGGDTEPKLNE
jgi:hypothetical protein